MNEDLFVQFITFPKRMKGKWNEKNDKLNLIGPKRNKKVTKTVFESRSSIVMLIFWKEMFWWIIEKVLKKKAIKNKLAHMDEDNNYMDEITN